MTETSNGAGAGAGAGAGGATQRRLGFVQSVIVGVVFLTTIVTITRNSPQYNGFSSNLSMDKRESATTNISSSLLRTADLAASPPTAVTRTPENVDTSLAPSGHDLTVPKCGMPWDDYYQQLPSNDKGDQLPPIQWTVSGGKEYQAQAGIILRKWQSLGIKPLLVVALDTETAQAVCNQGFHAVHWNADIRSYSRVADAKFHIAAALGDKGYAGFFIEMDVFCRSNPVPRFLDQPEDLVTVGHGDVGYFINIGIFFAKSRMAPYFHGLNKVLAHSLTHEKHTNQANWTVKFFDQNIFQHCMPLTVWTDDDINPAQFEYFHFDDTDRKNDLLKDCQEFTDFTMKTLSHHVMSNHDPPTIFDSTLCIHPLASWPFTPLGYKMGTAKFFGWDPKPIGKDEQLLKLHAGDLEFNDCWSTVFTEAQHLDDFNANDRIAMLLAALIEFALATDRTLILPRYIRSKESHAIPTHAIINVMVLPVPYRFVTDQQGHELEHSPSTRVVEAIRGYWNMYNITTSAEFKDAKILSINRICRIRDYKVPELEKRKAQLKFCFGQKELEWSKAVGGWMEFCGSY